MINSSFWKNKRVLLTGHTGFKGSWFLIWLLKLGADVWCYSLKPDFKPNLFEDLHKDISNEKNIFKGKFHHHIGDINNQKKLIDFIGISNPDIVFHLAAQPLVRQSYKEPINTWSTNVMGSLNLLEGLKKINKTCAVVMITTDKVYLNKEWEYGYRENDQLGGHDPYSASKAAAEIAISSWRSSFCGDGFLKTNFLKIATARAGNVIGGGDWSSDRIIPDVMRSLLSNQSVEIRNPESKRPWQHVLEPLSGYLKLAELLFIDEKLPHEAYNFGPSIDSNKSVQDLVETIFKYWPGAWQSTKKRESLHEAKLLHLQIEKAKHYLDWVPKWDFDKTIELTVNWYKSYSSNKSALECCMHDLLRYID